jgi:hypothetical protein
MGVVSRETVLRAEVTALRAEVERLRLDGREAIAAWMGKRGYATGHGDTIEDLLVELEGQLLRARETFGDGSGA